MAVEDVTTQDLDEVLKANDKVIVKFYADWCGSCKLFAPKFRRLSEDDRFKGITFIDINAEKNEAARKKAGVDNLPFFASFKSGELLASGPTSKEDAVVEMIEKLK